MYTSIIVGTDGSPTAQRAVARAIELAKLCEATLHVVSAFRPMSSRALTEERANLPAEFGWQVSSTSAVESALASARRLTDGAGITVEGHAVEGDPVEAILDTAQAVEAGVIVVGSKGMERRVMGSVPNSIAHRAERDVLIVSTA